MRIAIPRPFSGRVFRYNVILSATVLAFVVAVSLAGCSNDDPYSRIGVSGSVTFDGQPVEDGQIRFNAKQGTTAPVVIEEIKGGRYATTKSGGMPAGQYRVEIRAYDPSIPFPNLEDPMTPRKQLLPLKYNFQSELELIVEPGKKDITQNYELTP